MQVVQFYYKSLRDAREDNEKTQEEIASYLGISRPQYQLYECGKREIPLHLLIQLGKLYNVSLDYLSGLISVPEKLTRLNRK